MVFHAIKQPEVICSLWTENNLHRRLLSLGSWDSMCIAVLCDFRVQYYILLLLSVGILSYTE